MLLVKPSDWPSNEAPIYLVTGGVAIWLQDPASVAGFSRVGLPLVPVTTAALTALTTALDPYLEYPIARVPPLPTQPSFRPMSDPLIDGGDPTTIYQSGVYDGGSSDTDFFLTTVDLI